MACLGETRLAEIDRVERLAAQELRRLSIKYAANLSYYEVYAAMIRAIEGCAGSSLEEIRQRAEDVTGKWTSRANLKANGAAS